MRVPKRRYDTNSQDDLDPYITQQKADKIKVDMERMIKTLRPKLINEVAEHAKNGDFSENAAYQMAKGKLRGLNNRVLVLQNILNKAIIINPDKNSTVVEIGSIVTVKTNNKKYTYQILGSQETNPEKGIISHLSPIGSALLGHKINDEFKTEINEMVNNYKIIKIDNNSRI